MNKHLEILFDKCHAFKNIHAVVRHEKKGESFFCFTSIFGVLYNFLKDDETASKIMHEYLQEHHHTDYDKGITNYQIGKITEKGLKPVLCKTLQRDGYCKGLCSSIGLAKSPISFLYKAKYPPLVFIRQDIRTLLQFFKTHKINGSDERVAMCLIAYKNPENNVVYPSVNTIALDTGLSEKTVKNALKRLVTKKLITKYLQRRKGAYPFNRYTLSHELLDGYKPKVGEHFSKQKVGVKSNPIPKASTGEDLET